MFSIMLGRVSHPRELDFHSSTFGHFLWVPDLAQSFADDLSA